MLEKQSGKWKALVRSVGCHLPMECCVSGGAPPSASVSSSCVSPTELRFSLVHFLAWRFGATVWSVVTPSLKPQRQNWLQRSHKHRQADMQTINLKLKHKTSSAPLLFYSVTLTLPCRGLSVICRTVTPLYIQFTCTKFHWLYDCSQNIMTNFPFTVQNYSF